MGDDLLIGYLAANGYRAKEIVPEKSNIKIGLLEEIACIVFLFVIFLLIISAIACFFIF
jgi:hypothetical protein